ncbi:hypothetical protein D3C77_358590 [compost metagenome]
MVLRTAETAEIKQALRRPVKHNAHPIHQVDDARSRFAHRFNRRLIRKEVSAVHRIVKMLPRGVTFTLRINGAVNTALRADGV